MTYDFLTFGEALLRLTPPNLSRLEQANVLEMHVAGTELNTAVGLARLGLRTRWVSRLTDNVIGRLVERTLIAQGVDTRGVVWTDEDRLGLYYMEEGRSPRASAVTYDRAGSAVSRISLSDFEAAGWMTAPPRLLHLTGITLALSDGCREVAWALVEAATSQGVKISFDLNHRSLLWEVATARAVCERYMAAADFLLLPSRDAEAYFGTSSLEALHERYPAATIVVTRGADGAEAITAGGATYHQAVFPAEAVSRVGGGDAFAAGFLYGVLHDLDLAMALRYGAAVAALKYTIPGDLPLVDRGEVERLVGEGGGRGIVR